MSAQYLYKKFSGYVGLIDPQTQCWVKGYCSSKRLNHQAVR
jgi:hypothetical protein